MTDSRPRISEEQARRLWERAAELQAEATRRQEQEKGQSAGEALPGSTSGDNDEAGGYSLLHVREAGAEAGIQPEFVDMALAEETVLELEGGGGETRLDRIATRLLRDGRPALEVRRSFAYPAHAVWLTLEDVLRGEPNEFDLLELQGGSPVEGGIAIFESPKRHRESDALPYWSTAADTLRYLVAIRGNEGEEEARGCQVLVRVPLRRSRRINGGLGVGAVGLFGGLGGAGGAGVVGLLAGSGGMAAIPLALALGLGTLGGAVGVGALSRRGWIAIYRWALRGMVRALEKALNKVDLELRRKSDLRLLPDQD